MSQGNNKTSEHEYSYQHRARVRSEAVQSFSSILVKNCMSSTSVYPAIYVLPIYFTNAYTTHHTSKTSLQPNTPITSSYTRVIYIYCTASLLCLFCVRECNFFSVFLVGCYVLYCVYLDTGTQLPKLPPGDHTSIPQFTRQGSSKQTKGITDAVRSPIKWF